MDSIELAIFFSILTVVWGVFSYLHTLKVKRINLYALQLIHNCLLELDTRISNNQIEIELLKKRLDADNPPKIKT